MVVIGGCIFVIVSVLVGFTMAGGHAHALIHPSEFVTIGGAALGALIVMSPTKVIKDLIKGLLQLLKGSPYSRAAYIDLFKLLYALGKIVRQEGLLGLDTHVSNPSGSAIFKQYPRLLNNHHIKEFLCSALSMIVDGKVDSEKLMSWLEEEIHVVEKEHHAAVAALAKTADALPGFGIVAAVLGIVVTMQAIGGPVDEIGHKVGAALVGTFLGILLSYGFFAPLAGRMECMGEQEATFFRAIATAVVAIGEGESPKDVIMRARRLVSTDCRPTQTDLNAIFKGNESAT